MGCEARTTETVASDALRRWLDQEGLPMPPGPSHPDDPMAESSGDEGWPSGWWILPMLATAAPVWAVLGWWILG